VREKIKCKGKNVRGKICDIIDKQKGGLL